MSSNLTQSSARLPIGSRKTGNTRWWIVWTLFFSTVIDYISRQTFSRVHNPYSALALICVALWGYASWSTMGLTLPSDLFPQDVVATVTGMSGLAAGLTGAAFTFAVGISADRFSYRPAFLAAGLLPLFATASLFLLIRSPKKNLAGVLPPKIFDVSVGD